MANIDIEAPGASDAALRAALLALLPAYSGASVRKSSWASTNYTAGGVLAWDTENHDTGGWFDVSSPTRLTVPSGVTRVDVENYVNWSGDTATIHTCQIWFKKNGTLIHPAYKFRVNTTGWYVIHNAFDISVAASDYFEVEFYVAGDTSITLQTSSHFKIRASEFSA